MLHDQAEGEIRSTLSLGVQYVHIGNMEAAKRCFNRCLNHPEDIDSSRATALLNLAWAAELSSDPLSAVRIIDEFQDLMQVASRRVSTSARWIKARALLRCGELDEASRLFESLPEDVERYCDPVDPFLLFCDHAAVLIRRGDAEGFAKAAASAQRFLPRLSPVARALATEMLEKSVADALGASDFRAYRHQLLEAVKVG